MNTTYEKEASVKNGVARMVFSVIVIALEVIFLIMLLTRLNQHAAWIDGLMRLFALLLVLGIYNKPGTSSMKTPWIILILLAPILGIGLYLIVGLNGGTRRMRRRYEAVNEKLMPMLWEGGAGNAAKAASTALANESERWAGLSNYLVRNSRYPLYRNTDITYYDDASKGLDAQKEALRKAEKFIFMEYHAIEDKESWHGLQEILEERVRAGVEVRVFYDDMGSIGFINVDFIKRLEKVGIQCRVFNPFMPGLNVFLNNRDHRKITVIDGKVGFTGGYNIANEYFNLTHPYGMWKDTGVRLEGEAVRSLTATFLENWNAVEGKEAQHDDFGRYLPVIPYTAAENAYVQPYADSPLDSECVGEEVYISLVNKANRYCWFITPYLILTDEMIHALGLAAKRGVDVRIVTPGIPDKKMIYQVTRSYYNVLARNGVRIYEWTPGFCHCKMCVVNDEAAVCGTINLDYRSLYHHFENGCLYMNCQAVQDTRADIERTVVECREVTEKYTTGRDQFLRFKQLLLRLFAPLM
ncbi:MAG: cardiolipin synthase [Clostridiales bacterium]|nr:cardiolipin synthase [Clostridiales bacterium]